MASYGEDFHNYASVEEDAAAADEVEKLTPTKYFAQYPNLNEAARDLGRTPRPSKMAMITKEIHDKIKRRLILDCLASGINTLTTQVERVVSCLEYLTSLTTAWISWRT